MNPLNIVPRKDQRLGSWGQAVKLTGTGNDWDDDDLPLTVEALNGTNQNLYIYTIDTQSDWENFLKLLDAVSDSDIKLFAAMQSPTDGATVTKNRWGVKGLKPISCAQTNDLSPWQCERDIVVAWLDAWCRAAEILSALSDCHPNLVGFLIDDFSGFVESADQPQCMFGRNFRELTCNPSCSPRISSMAAFTSRMASPSAASAFCRRLGRDSAEAQPSGLCISAHLRTPEGARCGSNCLARYAEGSTSKDNRS